MGFILERYKPIGHTEKAVKVGHLLLIDYHPPYVELECRDPDTVAEEAREKGLKLYTGKKHLIITDGIYRVKIYK